MAEDTSQEKTEEATARRLEKAREEGQVARSRELNTSVILLAGVIGLLIFGEMILEGVISIAKYNFHLDRRSILDHHLLFLHLKQSTYNILITLMPYMAMVALAAFIAPLLLGGWLFAPKSLAPKMNRISLIQGFKRMFSLKSLVELLKSWLKVIVVGVAAYIIFMMYEAEIRDIKKQEVFPAIAHSVEIILWGALFMAASTLIIAAVDIPFQIMDHAKKLKMTLQEIKDEMKETEGRPEVKSKVRQLQREAAQRRMMADVPDADVIITNPTHYSVALKYDQGEMDAPIVVAKGVDHVALKIREIANNYEITMVEAPPLARAIYHTTDIQGPIPEGLYVAVAQILAYVYQLKMYKDFKGPKPQHPKDFDIPDDLQFDE